MHIVKPYPKMQMGSCGPSCTAHITNYLSFFYSAPFFYPRFEAGHMHIFRYESIVMIDFHVIACRVTGFPDNDRPRPCRADGSIHISRNINAAMIAGSHRHWPPISKIAGNIIPSRAQRPAEHRFSLFCIYDFTHPVRITPFLLKKYFSPPFFNQPVFKAPSEPA